MFSLNSTNPVTKRLQTCHLLHKRPGCCHSTCKTHVRDRIFKLSPIDASVIIKFSEFAEFSESHSGKNSTVSRGPYVILASMSDDAIEFYLKSLGQQELGSSSVTFHVLPTEPSRQSVNWGIFFSWLVDSGMNRALLYNNHWILICSNNWSLKHSHFQISKLSQLHERRWLIGCLVLVSKPNLELSRGCL